MTPAAGADASNWRGNSGGVRYATLANFPAASLIAGAERGRRMDIAMMIWVLKGVDGRIAIVDSGFQGDQSSRNVTVKDYLKPSEAIAPLGIKPDQVTDLLLTHAHWDHAGGIDLFPAARVWIQKAEYDYYTSDAWQADSVRKISVDPAQMSTRRLQPLSALNLRMSAMS